MAYPSGAGWHGWPHAVGQRSTKSRPGSRDLPHWKRSPRDQAPQYRPCRIGGWDSQYPGDHRAWYGKRGAMLTWINSFCKASDLKTLNTQTHLPPEAAARHEPGPEAVSCKAFIGIESCFQ